MKGGVCLIALATLGLSFVQAATAQETTNIWEGVFTEEQVARGETAYMESCASCHGEELVSEDAEVPALTAPAFRWSWQTKTIAEKFERIKTTMPLGQPESLDDQTYADIVAFILHFNGYPTGSTELTADPARLESIEIALEP